MQILTIVSKYKIEKERDGFMRKSMKKIAATAFTAAMTMGLAVTAFGAEIDPTAIPAGETVFTVTGNMTTPQWALNDDANAMKATEFDGIVSFDLTMPAYDEANAWASRFSIGAFNSDTLVAGWNRILLGVPSISVGDLGNGLLGDMTNLTQVRVATAEETAVTVYFDTETYGLAILDAEGNSVEYQIGWATSDDQETYFTPEQFAEMTWADYTAQLGADRAANLATLGVTELPDFVALRDAVIAKMTPQEEENESGEIDPTQIPAGETIFTVTGNMTNPQWALNDKANKMKEVNNGILAFYATMPAYDEANAWASRFSIGAFNSDTLVAGWNRILLGVPTINVGDLGNGMLGDLTNLTQVRVATPEETEVVILFDPETYGLAILDLEGNQVEYQIGWATSDDQETYFTPEQFADMTWDEYIAQLGADRAANLETLGVTELPDFATLRDDVVAKFLAEEEEPSEEPSEDEEEPSEDEEEPSEDEEEPSEDEEEPSDDEDVNAGDDDDDANAGDDDDANTGNDDDANTGNDDDKAETTTAKDQATNTGDAAPVAVVFALFAAVAVAFAAKKKAA